MNGIIARALPAPSLVPPRARSNMMAFPETDAAAVASVATRHMAIQPAKRKALRIQRGNDLQAAPLCSVHALVEERNIVMMGCFSSFCHKTAFSCHS